MKRRLMTLFLIPAVLSGFVSCGRGADAPEKTRVANVFGTTELDMIDDFDADMMTLSGDDIVLTGRHITSTSPYSYREVLCTFSRDIPEEMKNGAYDYKEDAGGGYSLVVADITPDRERTNVIGTALLADGELAVLTETYDENYEERTVSVSVFADGKYNEAVPDVGALLPDAAESVYGSMYRISSGNRVTAVSAGRGVVLFDADFKVVGTLDAEGDISSLSRTPDGRMYVSYSDVQDYSSPETYAFIDTDKLCFTDEIILADDSQTVGYYFGADGAVYRDDGMALFRVGNDSETIVADWVNSDVIRSDISMLLPVTDEKIAVLRSYRPDDGYMRNSVFLMERIPDGEVAERYVLTLAADTVNESLARSVVDFNRLSSEYRVEVKAWHEDAADGQCAGGTALENAVMSGDSPDIFLTSSFEECGKWAAAGFFADLGEMMDSDPEFDRGAFFPGALAETDGEIWQIVTNAAVRTYSAKRSTVGSGKWTTDAFMSLAGSLPDGSVMTVDESASAMSMILLDRALGDFVDETAGTCDFDSGEFGRIIEFIKSYEDMNGYESLLSGDELADYRADRNSAYREDKVALKVSYIGMPSFLLSDKLAFGGDDIVYPGEPDADGGGGVLVPLVGFSVSADTALPDGAWEFVRYIAERADVKGSGLGGFPTLRSRFDAMMSEERKKRYACVPNGMGGVTLMGFEGENMPRFPGMDGSDVTVLDYTDDDISTLTDIFECAEISRMESRLAAIVYEELTEYFGGKRTTEDAVKIIQDRVGTYLAERQ